jgi:hypothetical protein
VGPISGVDAVGRSRKIPARGVVGNENKILAGKYEWRIQFGR